MQWLRHGGRSKERSSVSGGVRASRIEGQGSRVESRSRVGGNRRIGRRRDGVCCNAASGTNAECWVSSVRCPPDCSKFGRDCLGGLSVVSRLVAEAQPPLQQRKDCESGTLGCSGWPWLRQLSAATLGAALLCPPSRVPARGSTNAAMGAKLSLSGRCQSHGGGPCGGLVVCSVRCDGWVADLLLCLTCQPTDRLTA